MGTHDIVGNLSVRGRADGGASDFLGKPCFVFCVWGLLHVGTCPSARILFALSGASVLFCVGARLFS